MRIVISLLAAGVLAGASAGAATAPRVAIDGFSPLVVVGGGFEHKAAVRVVVSTSYIRMAKTVTSTAAGAIHAKWARALPLRHCAQVVVSATSADRRAVAKRVVSCPAPRLPVQDG